MNETVQNKRYDSIDLLKVFLSIAIVCRHAELVSMAGRDQAFDYFNRMGMLFSDLMVPMFFILSGFLFFLNVPEKPGIRFFTEKWKRRVFSLVIPYVIANCVAFLCYWLAYRYYPSMMSGFLGENWKNPLFVFWTGPVNLSLWFIRDLIIAVLCAPLTWLLVRYTRFWGVLALGLVYYFLGMHPWYNFFFAIGAWAAMYGKDVKELCVKTGPWWLLLYICTYASALKFPELHRLVILPGFPLMIYAVTLFTEKTGIKAKPQWAAWCFFLYLYHYIPELVFKKVLVEQINPSTTWSLIFTLFAVSLLTLAFITGLYFALKKLLPRLTGVLVGGKL
jgi:hypothetical protein